MPSPHFPASEGGQLLSWRAVKEEIKVRNYVYTVLWGPFEGLTPTYIITVIGLALYWAKLYSWSAKHFCPKKYYWVQEKSVSGCKWVAVLWTSRWHIPKRYTLAACTHPSNQYVQIRLALSLHPLLGNLGTCVWVPWCNVGPGLNFNYTSWTDARELCSAYVKSSSPVTYKQPRLTCNLGPGSWLCCKVARTISPCLLIPYHWSRGFFTLFCWVLSRLSLCLSFWNFGASQVHATLDEKTKGPHARVSDLT